MTTPPPFKAPLPTSGDLPCQWTLALEAIIKELHDRIHNLERINNVGSTLKVMPRDSIDYPPYGWLYE